MSSENQSNNNNALKSKNCKTHNSINKIIKPRLN